MKKNIKYILSSALLLVILLSVVKSANAVSPSPVSFGGTGVGTITGIPYGTGTAPLGIVTIGSGVSFSGGTLSATGSGGTVTSVSGTSNRITSTGGTTPVIDISASYVGQSSITTLGTIGTGTWQGNPVGTLYGGTGCTSASITCFNNITGFTAAGATGTTSTNLVFSGSPTIATPTFTTSAVDPLLIGGSGTTQTLTLQSTSGIGASGANIIFKVGNNGGTTALTILNSGQIGVGSVTTPTADFMLPAGTATAGTAPLRFTSGTNLTTPVDGAMEYNGSHLFVDIGSSRFQLDQQGTAANLIIGTSTITGGSTGNVLYDNGGTLGEMTTTGSGTVNVLQTSPTLTTPVLGVATATSIAIGGATIGSNGLAVSGHLLFEGVTSTGATGTGNLVFSSAPTFTTSIASPIVNATTGVRINNAASSGTILTGNGTNYVASAYTVASPGTASNVLTSDGTNWTSGAPSGAWKKVLTVAFSSVSVPTSTVTTLADFTGLTGDTDDMYLLVWRISSAGSASSTRGIGVRYNADTGNDYIGTEATLGSTYSGNSTGAQSFAPIISGSGSTGSFGTLMTYAKNNANNRGAIYTDQLGNNPAETGNATWANSSNQITEETLTINQTSGSTQTYSGIATLYKIVQ